MKVAVVGATGYSGAELVRLLHNHPRVSIHSIHASSMFGKRLASSYPHMESFIEHTLEEADIDTLAKEVDLVFTATPNGVARKLAPMLLNKGLKVIDLSGDFRIKDRQVYEAWYGLEATEQSLLDQAVYGLTEWNEETLKGASLVANPGCFPTGVLLGLLPLVKENIIDESSIIIDAKTGVSGAGKGLSQATHYAETNDNFKIYKANEHQHTPEIEQGLRLYNNRIEAVTFSPHLAPMTRGILATMYATATKEITTAKLYELYSEQYKDNFFIRIHKKGTFPATKEVYSSNFCDIGMTYDKRTNRITIVTAIDNLVKGAAGQAVQNMNLLFGFKETTGLQLMPIYP